MSERRTNGLHAPVDRADELNDRLSELERKEDMNTWLITFMAVVLAAISWRLTH